jgi:YggT family protein
MPVLVYIIVQLISLLTWVVFAAVVLSYFVDQYNPVRMALDRFVEPMLAPLRRSIPPISGIDLSPVALILILQVLRKLVIVFFS